ncbi:MAG TPA: MurR/RpiR family transcriptional regulator [Jatrophihabitantaceae bacterium]|jgi:DNA-binding MurR/RpiR family transcriptional regulator
MARRRSRTVAEVLRGGRAHLTPAELRVAQTLMADYPAAGLQPVAALAERAGVSGPTVVRLVAKLGFAGFADLQARLRAELSARNAGPVQRYPDAEGGGRASPLLRRFERSVTTATRESLLRTDTVEFDTAVELLSDVERPVGVTGGRVSSVHAQYLARSLALLRPDVRSIAAERAVRAAYLLDIEPGAVVVVFDYRRYDDEVIEFGRGAAAAGASVVLMTDTYLSPLASAATVLLTSSVDGPAPFITLTPALALVEALVLGAVERGGPPPRRRLERFDALSADLSAAT